MRPALLIAMLAAWSCSDTESASVDAGPPLTATAQILSDIDVLLVMDNTGNNAVIEPMSMGVQGIFDGLGLADDAGPTVRFGVTTGDLGDGGNGIMNCQGDGDDGRLVSSVARQCGLEEVAYLESRMTSAGRQSNATTRTDVETLACTTSFVSVTGCGFHRPIQAIQHALDGRNGDFPRPDAFLAVIVAADEDDCSFSDAELLNADPDLDTPESPLGPLTLFRCFEFGVECSPDEPRTNGTKSSCRARGESPYFNPLEPQVEVLRQSKVRKDMLQFYGFTSVGDPTVVETYQGAPSLANVCTSGPGPWGEHGPTPRLDHFFDLLPGSINVSQCQVTFEDDLRRMGEAMLDQIETLSCTSAPLIDTDRATPGIQPSCIVTQVTSMGALGETRTGLAPCDGIAAPCYRFEEDASCESNARLVIDGQASLPPGTSVLATCGLRP